LTPDRRWAQLTAMAELPVLRTVAELRDAVASWRGLGESIGLVPTMGALHEGHLALVRAAKRDCRRAVATLFVNPTQFGPNEDLASYPRDETKDRALLAGAGVDLLFAPEAAEVYPKGFATRVAVEGLTRHLCGPHRPGHFEGVATVVTKLLNMASATRAYFGEKDFQQLQVIRRLAADLNIPTEIVGVPTVREADGLALSSRNRYLGPAERKIAGALPQTLREAARRIGLGEPLAPVLAAAREALSKAGFAKLDYLELADEAALVPRQKLDKPARVFAAAWIGKTRLIDNWPVEAPKA
jgi:pantoate--beta-alanine ligase